MTSIQYLEDLAALDTLLVQRRLVLGDPGKHFSILATNVNSSATVLHGLVGVFDLEVHALGKI